MIRPGFVRIASDSFGRESTGCVLRACQLFEIDVYTLVVARFFEQGFVY
jgi:hypothetical protein